MSLVTTAIQHHQNESHLAARFREFRQHSPIKRQPERFLNYVHRYRRLNLRIDLPKGGLERGFVLLRFSPLGENLNKIAFTPSAYYAWSASSAFWCALVVTGSPTVKSTTQIGRASCRASG